MAEKKKAFYIGIGVFFTVAALIIGAILVLLKNYYDTCEDQDFDEYWDDEDDEYYENDLEDHEKHSK